MCIICFIKLFQKSERSLVKPNVRSRRSFIIHTIHNDHLKKLNNTLSFCTKMKFNSYWYLCLSLPSGFPGTSCRRWRSGCRSMECVQWPTRPEGSASTREATPPKTSALWSTFWSILRSRTLCSCLDEYLGTRVPTWSSCHRHCPRPRCGDHTQASQRHKVGVSHNVIIFLHKF